MTYLLPISIMCPLLVHIVRALNSMLALFMQFCALPALFVPAIASLTESYVMLRSSIFC